MTARLYDRAGRYVELDSRHTIRPEHCGQARPRWVFRFCGEWVEAFDFRREATAFALRWEMDRVARMERAAGIA